MGTGPEVGILMAISNWILPRADAACGKVFHPDRKSAEGHRIALEFWNQATGRNRPGDHLVTFRCRRCGGFHVARKSSKTAAAEPTRVLAVLA